MRPSFHLIARGSGRRFRPFTAMVSSLTLLATLVGIAASGAAAAAPPPPAWSIAQSPNPSGAGEDYLRAVSCAKGAMCKAVGDYGTASGIDQPLVESWDGTSWSTDSSPSVGQSSNLLEGVSCPTPKSCKAVGYYINAGLMQTLSESWNGASWSTDASPNAGAGSNVLNGVACPAPDFCQAVGSFVDGSGVTQTLVETWDGTAWSIETSPDANATNLNTLSAVSCPSIGFCQAVGSYSDGNSSKTLIESWGGGSWTRLASPNLGLADDLQGVSCPTGGFCQAVGAFFDGFRYVTLTESWNGSTWTADDTSVAPPGDDSLLAVSCVSATLCKAVGSDTASGAPTLIESWNGTAWSPDGSPSPVGDNQLGGVSCVSPKDCETAGINYSPVRTLIERFAAKPR